MRPSKLEPPHSLRDHPITPSDTSPKQSHPQSSRGAAARSHPISYFMMSGDSVDQRSNAAPAILTTAASPQSSPASQRATASAASDPISTPEQSFNMPSPDTEASTYGVQSLEDVMSVADSIDPLHQSCTATPEVTHHSRSNSSSSFDSSPSTRSPARQYTRPPSVNTLSMPLTPVFALSPLTGLGAYEADGVSTPRSTSLRSFRLEASDDDSDREDDSISQAVTSGSDEECPPHASTAQPESWQTAGQSSAPLLVMPSVTMPKRRPFTEKGKQMGKLKILLAGSKGSGKSSLIKSIVQACEDIVHVDPVEVNHPTLVASPRRDSAHPQDARNAKITAHVTEIYASTKAFPSWWSDIEESKLLRRRKSFNDTVLERNICFVDTPGYDRLPSTANNADAIVRYVESLLHRTSTFPSMSSGELLSLLAGNGGVQVDVVLFCISREQPEAELHLLRRLATLTNVIPIIAKADQMSHGELDAAKTSTLRRLQTAEIQPFLFGHSMSGIIADPDKEYPPYTVSSALSSTDDTMDASLLMSPDYRPPLHASDLPTLVSRLFDPSTASWLRHAAAKKFISWRRSNSFLPPSLSLNTLHPPRAQQPTYQSSATTSSAYTTSSVVATSISPSAVIVSTDAKPPSAPSYTISRLADHTQREDRFAQVRLARWASDLQRALRNERERFAALQDAERNRWLRERLGECVSPTADLETDGEKGALMRLGDARNDKWRSSAALVDPRDPLGLLALDERVRWRAGRAATVLGGAGLVGAVVVWCVRYLEWHAALHDSLWGADEGTWVAGDGRSMLARVLWG
ncbi:hypothetical protein FH972_025981 [Carpinus fangiana]|uniref:Septin-type G domain-containing protein n=1 Tax=Carpinus fangiana TaxID=176857 RepID=A0A5N6L2U8_9ROSI|nr:hypothetical protein FH972_025981 [Carpinus fangiana]